MKGAQTTPFFIIGSGYAGSLKSPNPLMQRSLSFYAKVAKIILSMVYLAYFAQTLACFAVKDFFNSPLTLNCVINVGSRHGMT